MKSVPKPDRNSFQKPDPLVGQGEASTHEYGLQMCVAIQREWFGSGTIDQHSLYMQRHQFIRDMRLLYRGEQNQQAYKNWVAKQEAEKELLNLDWTFINIAEKFCNVPISGLSDDFYRLDIRSADKLSLRKKKEERRRHIKNMFSKPMLEKAREINGVDLTPTGFVPESEEELNIHAEMREKPKQEIAEEITINFVKEISYWDRVKRDCDKDLVVCGLSAARVFTHPKNGVTIKYVDIESFGHSFVEKNDFSDAFYFFEVDTITINQLRIESNFTDKELIEIAEVYKADNDYDTVNLNNDTLRLDDILDWRVHVMRFTFKADKKQVYKKYMDRRGGGVRKVAKRDEGYDVPEGSESSKLESKMGTWYEGSYVVGSNKYLYDYKESENIVFDKLDRPLPPFVAQADNIYKNKLKSFLSNIAPLIQQMQYQHLKIQQLVSELKPDIIELDLDALADITLDGSRLEGKGQKWEAALSILNVKGVVFKKRVNMGEDGIKDVPAARPTPTSQGTALNALLNVWAQYYNTIREVTGVNPAMDGTLQGDALVGINQLMRLAGNAVTKHIADAALDFDRRICELVSTRVKQVFSHKEAKHIQQIYEHAVGIENVEALEAMKNRHLHEFGFSVELVPSKEDLDLLREDLSIAIQEQTIDVSDKSEIMDIARVSMKQARQYMNFVRKRNIREKMRQQEFNIKVQGENNERAAMAAAQAEMQKEQMKAQLELMKYQKKKAIDIQYEERLSQIQAPEKQADRQHEIFLEETKAMVAMTLEKYKEDRKDERQDRANSQQSQLIEQRQNSTAPKSFENPFKVEDLLA